MKEEVTVLNTDGQATGLQKLKEAAAVDPEHRKKVADLLNGIEEMEVTNVAGERYWEPSKGESVRGVFTGYQVLTKNEGDETKELPAIRIETKKEGVFLNAGGALVMDFIKNGIQPYTPVQVTLTEKKKTGSGHTVNLFKIEILG